MSAKVDATEHSIVVWCDRCPTFSESASSIQNAHDIAVDHEALEHPELHAAMECRRAFRAASKKRLNLAA